MTANGTGPPAESVAPVGPDADVEAPAVDRPWWRHPLTLRFLLVLTLFTCLLGYAEKASCRDTRNWTDQFQYTALCYSDVVALYGAEKLDAGERPYLDYPVEYPVLIGAAMWGAAGVSDLAPEPSATGQDLRVAVFSDATAVLLTLAAGAVVVATTRLSGRRRRDALFVVLAPSLVLHAFTNWDLLAVAFATTALLAWSRRSPWLAGVLLGLGAATKFYPILFLVPLGLLCLRAGRMTAWARTAGAAVASAVVVNLPVYLCAGWFTAAGGRGPGLADVLHRGGGLGAALAPHHTVPGTGSGTGTVATNGLLRFLDLNSERVADWDSLAYAWQYVTSAFSPEPFGPVHVGAVLATLALVLVGVHAVRHRRRATPVTAVVGLALLVVVALGTPPLATWTHDRTTVPVPALNLVTALAFLAALAGIAVLVLRAPRRPRVASVVFLTVAAFLLTNKVFSPQYVLWMLPLVALALPRWRPFVLWQVAEALVLVTRYYYFAGVNSSDVPSVGLGWFVAAVALRDAALVGLAVLVVRDIRQPERDPVRRDADGEDPLAGVLAAAPDRFVLSRRRDRRRDGSGPTEVPASGTEPESADVRA